LVIVGQGSSKGGKLSFRRASPISHRLPDIPDMVNAAIETTPAEPVFTDESLRTIIFLIIAYWGLLAVVLPVSNVDSHVYNLGRLAIAENAGFWQKSAWNSPRQVVFPWTFDAVHYPFLKIGWGCNLPSFFSFLGILVIVFELVSGRWGTNVASWSVLSLLAMPTIMTQATTTKNDIVVVFGVACWLYSLVRFQTRQSKFFILTAALSLAFTAGSKTYAVPICAILTVVTAWIWRKEARNLLVFAGFSVPCILLFGSIETYVLSWQIYHRPLGPVDFVHDQRNRDGLRGLSANFIRYYLGNFSFGIDGYANQSGLAKFLESRCRKVLHYLHLNNVGYAFPHFFSDKTLDLTKKADEYYSDYGLVGFAALLTSSIYVWRPKLRNPSWILAVSGFAALALNSLIVGWMPWNARFLCLSFVLFGVAMSIILFGELRRGFWWRQLFGVMIVWSAFTLPFLCVDRRPIDVARAFNAREDFTFDQSPGVRQVFDDVISFRKKEKGRWFLVAGKNSYILPFLELKDEPWILTPNWELWKYLGQGIALQSFVLVLNRSIPARLPAEIVKQYGDNTYILKVSAD
jgi:Dolichyl-phosphate-mannose-protein mannosyltransferase